MDESTPSIQTRGDQPYVGIRASVTVATINQIADRVPEVFGWLAAHDLAPAGAPFLRYHVVDMARELVVEAGVPVAAPTAGDGPVTADVLPAGRYACLTHVGPPTTIPGANSRLLAWGAEQRVTWDRTDADAGERWGCRLETLLSNPATEPDPNTWVTEIAIRLA